METKNENTLPEKLAGVAAQLNRSVLSVIGAKNIEGFEKTYLVAEATSQLKKALTTEYMKPIMELQGSKLGFKADKNYPEETVKNCLIEAVLTGVQPVGNQFNIIMGNCYITKEGFGYLLKNIEGLSYEIIPQLPRIQTDKGSGAVVMKIRWTIEGKTNERDIDFAIKVNSAMGADAVIGKATRKARAWLHSTITNTEISDGDINDLPVFDVPYEEEITLETLNLLYDMKQDSLTPDEQNDAERIIKSKEEKSYKKLQAFLKSK